MKTAEKCYVRMDKFGHLASRRFYLEKLLEQFIKHGFSRINGIEIEMRKKGRAISDPAFRITTKARICPCTVFRANLMFLNLLQISYSNLLEHSKKLPPNKLTTYS